MINLWHLLLSSLIAPPINKRCDRTRGYTTCKTRDARQSSQLYTNTDNVNNLNWAMNSSLISRTPTESILRLTSNDEDISSLLPDINEITSDIYDTVAIEELKDSPRFVVANKEENNEIPLQSQSSKIEEFLCLYGNEQFLANNIQEILVKKGSETNSAREAGESVQVKAYERFLSLQQRRSKSNIIKDYEIDGVSNDDYDVKYYDVESVIDVLTKSGLSGRDCAAILHHTPSIALMKPKRDDDNSNHMNTVEDIINCILKDVLSGLLKLRKYDARKVSTY